MKSKITLYALFAVLVLSVTLLVVLTNLELKEKEQYKSQLKEIVTAHNHMRDSVYVKTIEVYDTITYPVPTYDTISVDKVSALPLVIQVSTDYKQEEMAVVLLDYLLWHMQNDGHIEVPMWGVPHGAHKGNAIIYYGKEGESAAIMLRDSIENYTGRQMSMSMGMNKMSNVIDVIFTK